MHKKHKHLRQEKIMAKTQSKATEYRKGYRKG